MKSVTLDTTVLAKGIIPPRRRKKDALYSEQLRVHKIAKSIMQDVESTDISMNIPSAAVIEIAAVAARLTGKENRGLQAAEYVQTHSNIVYDILLFEESIKLAAKIKASGFDTVFIACAKITNSVLITDDKGMHEAAKKAGIKSELLRDMKQEDSNQR